MFQINRGAELTSTENTGTGQRRGMMHYKHRGKSIIQSPEIDKQTYIHAVPTTQQTTTMRTVLEYSSVTQQLLFSIIVSLDILL